MKLDVLSSTRAEAWYAGGLRFTCTQCGNCCTGGPGFVWISREEIGRLADHLELTVEETIERYCRKIGERFSLREVRNSRGEHDCVFLKEEPADLSETHHAVVHTKRICSIYPVRPLQCRTWPFWESNLANPEIWDASAQRCHGMNRGRRYSKREMETLRDAKDWPEEI